MSDEERNGSVQSADKTKPSADAVSELHTALPQKRELVPLPGLVAIAFYLLLLAVIIIVGVVGGHYPAAFVLLPVFLFAACGGLLMLFRWAWAMALAAVLMLIGFKFVL